MNTESFVSALARFDLGADIPLPPDSVEKLMVKSEGVAKPLRYACGFLASGG